MAEIPILKYIIMAFWQVFKKQVFWQVFLTSIYETGLYSVISNTMTHAGVRRTRKFPSKLLWTEWAVSMLILLWEHSSLNWVWTLSRVENIHLRRFIKVEESFFNSLQSSVTWATNVLSHMIVESEHTWFLHAWFENTSQCNCFLLSSKVNIAERTCCCLFCKCIGEDGTMGDPGPSGKKVILTNLGTTMIEYIMTLRHEK